MGFLQPFLQRVTRRTRKPSPKLHEFCGDELRKKSSSVGVGVKVKKRVRFDLKQPSFIKRDDEKKKDEEEIISQGDYETTQVKILMTKAEAARLLARCKDGGILELQDVANDLHFQNSK